MPRLSPLPLALLLVLFAGGAYAQQGWQGGVDSSPLPPANIPDGPVQDPDTAPLPPGVPPIIETPAAPAPGTRTNRQPAAQQRVPAQQQPVPGTTPAPAPGTPDSDVELVQPPSQKIANKTAVFSGLDKITGRIITFDVAVNETVQFGALRITPRVCYTRPATETQNTTGFVEVQEQELDGEVKKIFSGWMFAASPGLHGVEHPIYDVWLTDCKQTAPVIASPGPQQ
ncbi:DUF2155 domain-containing protein [Ancylobacter crimeensis]|uniref:DUF2155 domain-containing protein n=1 Tax=Ancylobacter crimeensis TaxID=2579147 RepID=UPI0031BA8D62